MYYFSVVSVFKSNFPLYLDYDTKKLNKFDLISCTFSVLPSPATDFRGSEACCAVDVHSWIHHCSLSPVTNLLCFSISPFISWHYGAAGSLRFSNWCKELKWQNNNNICLVSNGIDMTLQVANCLCCEVCLDDTSSLWQLRSVSGFAGVNG